jgi:membrane-associated phospholipid phosphatase
VATVPRPSNVLDPEARGRREGRLGAVADALRHWPVGLPSVAWLMAWGAVLLLVMIGLGTALAGEGGPLHELDTSLVKDLAAARTPTLNTVTSLVTRLAETYTITGLALIAFIGFRVGYHRWREAALVAAAVAGEVTIFLLTTLLVDRQRPPVPKLDHAPPTSSFPSGHVAAAIVMYGALAVVASGRVRSGPARIAITCAAVLIPLAVAVARVYRGMHFPTDVLGGALLGLVWLAISVLAVRLGVLHVRLRARAGGRR